MPPTLLRLALLLATILVLAACSTSAPRGTARSSSSDADASGRASFADAPSPNADAAVGLDVGQRAPAFSVTGMDGRQVSDSDLRAQGKPYILYFYATW